MRDRDDRALVLLEESLEPRDGFGVQVVRRLVEQQEVRRLQQQAAERHAAALAPGDRADIGVGRRHPQRVHRDLQPRVEVPCASGFDAVLELPLLIEDLLHLPGREFLGQALREAIVIVDERPESGHALLDVAEDGLGRDRDAAPAEESRR